MAEDVDDESIPILWVLFKDDCWFLGEGEMLLLVDFIYRWELEEMITDNPSSAQLSRAKEIPLKLLVASQDDEKIQQFFHPKIFHPKMVSLLVFLRC